MNSATKTVTLSCGSNLTIELRRERGSWYLVTPDGSVRYANKAAAIAALEEY